MSDTPLKAIPEATVEGYKIRLSAAKSTGDICGYGWAMSLGSPDKAKVKFFPKSSMKGQKTEDKKSYISNSCPFITITAEVDTPGEYIFSLQVVDKDKNDDWADIKVTVSQPVEKE
jgi:hypothetical protein